MAKKKDKRDKKQFLYGDNEWEISLSKFVGKKIVDVIGYPSDPFGGTPLFITRRIVFEDGSTVTLEGEHDVPYIPAKDDLQNMDEKTLEGFIEN